MLDHHLWIKMARVAPIKHIPMLWAAARHHPEAKNVSRAAAFAQETLHILKWIQSQPDLISIVAKYRNEIRGGAYRLTARYLLDGGLPAEALKYYARALRYYPGFACQHWKRMLYALASLLGLQGFAEGFKQRINPPSPDLSDFPGLEDWPGLKLVG